MARGKFGPLLGTLVLGMVFASIFASTGFAQSGGALDTVQNSLANAAKSWESTLISGATSLFWLLATIEIGLAAVWLGVNAASLEVWATELVKRIIFIGFFAFVLTQGPQLAKDIVDSLWGIGSGSVSGKLSPADLFDTGLQVNGILNEQIQNLDWTAIAQALMLAGSGLIVLLCMALFAAVLLSVIVEMYIGLIAGMIMLGLGGSSYTKDFAVRYLIYAFSIGMKLMALSIIAKTGSSLLTNLAADPTMTTTASGPGMLAAIALAMFALSIFVPNIVQGMVQGVSAGSGMEVIRSGQGTSYYAGAAFRQTASVAGGIAGAGIGAAGLASGSYQAGRAASDAGHSPARSVAAAFGTGGKALASAAADKLTGAPSAHGSSTLGLANHKLKQSLTNKPTGGGSSPKSS